MTHKALIVGNWKMNGSLAEAQSLLSEINRDASHADIVVCPTFIALHVAVEKGFNVGGQDCHTAEKGAFTGNISATMLKDAGCKYVILGHSERRAQHDESNQLIAQKAEAAHASGLTSIICIGETSDQRKNGSTLDVLAEQLKHSIPQSADASNSVIAYEPVWAIGTGDVATYKQISEVHDFINTYVAETFPLFRAPVNALYGGSVNAENAKSILALDSVGGVLVGGASLKADAFNTIIEAAK